MTEQSRTQMEHATPAQWIERLEIFRERFRLGLIDESKFKAILKAFQFSDGVGHIWMPGATSNQWYRWDRTRWTSAMPPPQLTASNIPEAIAMAWNRRVVSPIAIEPSPAQPKLPRGIEQSHPVPMDATPAAPPPTMLRAICPHCGESYIAPAKFCPNCGNLITGERVASSPASVPKKPARPTDLPERGVRRKPSKPTDLPR